MTTYCPVCDFPLRPIEPRDAIDPRVYDAPLLCDGQDCGYHGDGRENPDTRGRRYVLQMSSRAERGERVA